MSGATEPWRWWLVIIADGVSLEFIKRSSTAKEKYLLSSIVTQAYRQMHVSGNWIIFHLQRFLLSGKRERNLMKYVFPQKTIFLTQVTSSLLNKSLPNAKKRCINIATLYLKIRISHPGGGGCVWTWQINDAIHLTVFHSNYESILLSLWRWTDVGNRRISGR